MELRLVFHPATTKGQSHQLKMSSQTIMIGIRKEEYIGFWGMDRNSCYKTIGVHPSFQMKLYHTAESDLIFEGKNVRSPDRQETHLQGS